MEFVLQTGRFANHLQIDRWWLASRLLIGGVAVALAWEPALWLVRSWVQPGYAGLGWLPCLAVFALLVWSWSSKPTHNAPPRVSGFVILLVTAGLRLFSQLIDINVVGALLLCVDIFALALIARVEQRQRPLSAPWLALLFAFCLPLEPMLQRVLGFGLQQVSAQLACGMLALGFEQLSCAGTRITVQGVDVFVDLPCSGARLLSNGGFMLALLGAVKRPRLPASVLLVGVFLVLVLVVNALRIALLGAGIAHADWLGFSVMSPPWHEAIGLLGVVVIACALYAFMNLLNSSTSTHTPDLPCLSSSQPQRRPATDHRRQALLLLALFPLALSIGAIKPRPLDVTPPLPPLQAPAVAADFIAQPQPLTAQEQLYFTSYGGSASRLRYGPHTLLLVTTASPLRHLHDPAICMSANGYAVELIGTDHSRGTTVYRARHADLGEYFLLVSYVSADGRVATSISEVVWHWLRQPSRWTMVQRIVPLEFLNQSAPWDDSVRRAFNV